MRKPVNDVQSAAEGAPIRYNIELRMSALTHFALFRVQRREKNPPTLPRGCCVAWYCFRPHSDACVHACCIAGDSHLIIGAKLRPAGKGNMKISTGKDYTWLIITRMRIYLLLD